MERRHKMKRSGWSGIAVLLAVALAWAVLPATPAHAEAGSDSSGAMIAVGLVVAVVVVYGLVSLRSDVDRYSAADTEKAIAHATRIVNESPLVFQTISAPMALQSQGAGAQTEIAGAGLGWRVSF